jgi:hypothetical protein
VEPPAPDRSGGAPNAPSRCERCPKALVLLTIVKTETKWIKPYGKPQDTVTVVKMSTCPVFTRDLFGLGLDRTSPPWSLRCNTNNRRRRSPRCLVPSMCSNIPGMGRRGRLRRCGRAYAARRAARLPVKLSAPTCSSTGCRDHHATSRGSGGCSDHGYDRSTCSTVPAVPVCHSACL